MLSNRLAFIGLAVAGLKDMGPRIPGTPSGNFMCGIEGVLLDMENWEKPAAL